MTPHRHAANAGEKNPAKESLRKEQAEQREAVRKGKDKALDEALKDTFPASDPIVQQAPVTPGAREP